MREPEKRLRSIGEVSELTGVPVKTIRYYADIGLLPPAAVTGARYRLYGAEEIWRLGLIRTLRHLDFSIKEIRRIISGRLSVSDAIALQLDAVNLRARHLERIAAILRLAGSSNDPERSLDHLRGVGEALNVEAADRNRYLAEKLRAAIVSEDAPESWQDNEVYLRNIALQLPEDSEELSPDQTTAWIELVGFVSDSNFSANMQGRAAPFWRTMREREIDPDWWQDQMEDISQRALSAIERGERPGNPTVQEIVEDWLSLFAKVTEQQPTPEFRHRLAEEVPTWFENEENQKLQELLSRLAPDGELPPYEKVNRLMLEGLRWEAARETRDG